MVTTTSGSFNQTPFMLFPGEELIFKTNPAWLLLAWPVAILLAIWLLYHIILCPYVTELTWSGLCFLLSSLAFPFSIYVFYLDWRFNRFYLTNYRLVKERGIIGQRFMSIFLEQVEDITVSYSIWGRIFGFGNITIESAGTWGEILYKGAPDPLEKIKRIEEEILKLKPKNR